MLQPSARLANSSPSGKTVALFSMSASFPFRLDIVVSGSNLCHSTASAKMTSVTEPLPGDSTQARHHGLDNKTMLQYITLPSSRQVPDLSWEESDALIKFKRLVCACNHLLTSHRPVFIEPRRKLSGCWNRQVARGGSYQTPEASTLRSCPYEQSNTSSLRQVSEPQFSAEPVIHLQQGKASETLADPIYSI